MLITNNQNLEGIERIISKGTYKINFEDVINELKYLPGNEGYTECFNNFNTCIDKQ